MANKATGLDQIRRYYGISRDEIAVFGDSMNDYAMCVMRVLRTLWTTLATHQDGASKVIAPHTERGVQKEMRRILEELA